MADDDALPVTPLPVPADAPGLVLFGGTFDPPHRAHVELASQARDLAAPGAWLVFVPAARSPFKEDEPTADEHRVAMLRLAGAPLQRAAVWTDEIDRSGAEPSYWIDTIRRAAAERPEARLWFLIGSDQAAEFYRWREPRAILGLAEPIVVARAPITSAESLGAVLRESGEWTGPEIAEWREALVETPTLAPSATLARSILRTRGPDDPALAELLDPAVLRYIREHALYRE